MSSSPRDALAVALDLNADEAVALGTRLANEVGYLKIGLSLFVAEGPSIVRTLRGTGARIFLDLKLHDIPNTVELAARGAGALGVSLLTIHASGGEAMVAAAVRGAAEGAKSIGEAPPKILAVTVLTSLSADDVQKAGFREPPLEAATRLAKLAVGAGAHGLVCSPREASTIRAAVGSDPLIVTPGIRPAGSATQDQSRVETPADAIASGSDVLVVGRPITQAADPIAAARAIVDEIGRAPRA